MALAEALKGNTTLETLRPAALPSNPSGHAYAAHGKRSISLHGVRVYPQCTLPPAPSRCSLNNNDFDDDAKQALKAAARSGLKLYL